MLLKINKKNLNDVKRYILLGPPNVGKSTLFNKLTWKVSSVSNIDRFTTTINKGILRKEKNIEIIDLPGITTFSCTGNDEEVTIDYILSKNYNGAINIVSGLSIHRDLMLTIRLMECGILKSLIVNMQDELKKDDQINYKHLELKLGVPVIPISAKKNINIPSVISSTNRENYRKNIKIKYNKKIESFLDDINFLISKQNISRRFIYLEALENKEYAINLLKHKNVYQDFLLKVKEYNIDNDDINSIEDTRLKFINDILLFNNINNKLNSHGVNYYNSIKKIDNFFLKPWVAIPGFILLICLIYFITFYQYAGGWIQEQFATNVLEKIQEIVNDAINNNTSTMSWVAGFVSDGILGGIFTVIGFLPWIIILFICMNIIEQIGILSRLSVVFDNSLKKFGINGRSLINIITGVGCNIPGILLSRNISNQKERTISVMISSLVSCSARVVVYGFISQALIGGEWNWLLSFGISIISILFAIIMGGVFSSTIFRHNSSLFISQIPKWRSVDVVVLFKRTLIEIYSFLKRTIIIVGLLNLIIWFLMSTGPNSNFILDINNETYVEQSFLFYISYPFRYLLYPIGLGFNYQWSITLISSFPAKEVAASTIETLFGSSESFNSIIFQNNYGIATITSFLIMFTFYAPCMATLVVMKKEIGWKYVLISLFSILLISYFISWIVFIFIASIINIINNTDFSTIGLVLLLVSFVLLIIIFMIHSLRIKLQNKGISENVLHYIRFKKIYIVISIFSFLFALGSTILVFI